MVRVIQGHIERLGIQSDGAAAYLATSVGLHPENDERYEREHWRRFLVLAVGTASREAAIRELKWDQVDLRIGRIKLNPEGRRQTKKRRATVPIAPTLAAELASWMAPWRVRHQLLRTTVTDARFLEDTHPVRRRRWRCEHHSPYGAHVARRDWSTRFRGGHFYGPSGGWQQDWATLQASPARVPAQCQRGRRISVRGVVSVHKASVQGAGAYRSAEPR